MCSDDISGSPARPSAPTKNALLNGVIDVQFIRMIRTYTLNALEVLSNVREQSLRTPSGQCILFLV